MRFNEKRTCLEFLDHGIPSSVYVTKKNWPYEKKFNFMKSLIDNFPNISGQFKKKVQFISDPFYQAFERSREKIGKAMQSDPIIGEHIGTFIMNVDTGVTKTLFYYFMVHGSFDIECVLISFTKSNKEEHPQLDFYVGRKFTKDENGGEDFVDTKCFLADIYEDNGVDAESLISEWYMLITFMKYCDIETKILEPKQKHRNQKGVRYLNETKQKIEILDSTWFTNLVVSGAFKVSGHLRLQPYKKNGEWQKKWIWIEDFEKHGYTRKAKGGQ
jgi:hypothetical protein